MRQKLYFLSILICVLLPAAAQRPPAIVSPEVHPDRSITFRYFSKKAAKINLYGEFLKGPVSLTKDTSGIWSVTIPPVAPDIYPYSFRVDSIETADPNNTYVFANERFKRSIVDIPAGQPQLHDLQDVPHGKISYRYYKSSALGVTRPLLVYTPAGFDPAKKYPVLYLIHGGSDTEETWTRVGRAHLIADNLIAQGRAKPMIIVMPYGNVRPNVMSDFTKDVLNDIIPFVESGYPVLTGSKNRAIAGFSVGGGQTLNIGLMNTGTFAYVSSYAPYTATEEFKRNFDNWQPDAGAINKKLKYFAIHVGTDDFLFDSVRQNLAMFKEKGINVKSFIGPGGHTWMNCKQYLAVTLQDIFK